MAAGTLDGAFRVLSMLDSCEDNLFYFDKESVPVHLAPILQMKPKTIISILRWMELEGLVALDFMGRIIVAVELLPDGVASLKNLAEIQLTNDGELNQLRTELSSAYEELEELRIQHAQADSIAENASRDSREASERLNRARDEIASLTQQKVDLESQRDGLNNRCEELKAEIGRLQTQLGTTPSGNNASEDQAEDSDGAEIAKLSAEIARLESEESKLRQQIQTVRFELQQANRQNATTKRDLEKLRDKFTEMSARASNAETRAFDAGRQIGSVRREARERGIKLAAFSPSPSG